MNYEVYFRCLLCNALILFEQIKVNGGETKDVEKALEDYYRGHVQSLRARDDRPVKHNCFTNTGFPLAEGCPPPQMGVTVFAGLKRK